MNSSPVLPASCFAVLLISCSLAAHDRITTKVTWDREIAPIVEARCVKCHSPGGRAPMPLTTYQEARPWAKAMKDEVLARRMPKWHVVRGYGDFRNDPSLSAFEIALIAAWADGGAPASAKATAGKPDSAKASASAKATADESAGKSAGKTVDKPAAMDIPHTRSVDVPCGSGSLPIGRLVGLRPTLGSGDSLRLTLIGQGGTEQPLLWLRDFDPAFRETYWLRNPTAITRATRTHAEAATPCTLTVLLESRRGK